MLQLPSKRSSSEGMLSQKNCRHCGKRHHQSICDTVHAKGVEETKEKSKQDDVVKTKVTTAASYENRRKRNSVLLQAARAVTLDETGRHSVPVRILLDTGNQRSYVTEDLRSKLKLKHVQREKLTLNTFGENRCKNQRCDLVNLRLQKPGNPETIEISALTFPVICSALPSTVNIDDYQRIQDLDLAEDFDNDNHDTIDVLIGSDYYWDIIMSESIRADYGPTAINSKFGWVLSGPVTNSLFSVDNTASHSHVPNHLRSIEIPTISK